MKIIICALINLYILTSAEVTEEYITIEHIPDQSQYRRHKRDLQSFPQYLHFRITQHNIKLTLRKNNLTVAVPYFVQEDNRIVKRIPNIDKEIVFYHDLEKTASFGIHCIEQENKHCVYKLTGSLVLNGKYHSLHPQSTNEHNDENIKHILKCVDENYQLAGDYRELTDMLKGINFKSRRLMSTSDSSDFTEHYKVEFLPVCDYALYSLWYNRSEGNTETEKYNNTVSSLIEHYAYVINTMNIHYASITGQTWDIEIVYAGIYIADSASASSWTESIKEVHTGDRLWVDITVALEKFGQWLQTASGLPDYDHAMSFTGYELYSGSYSPGILGLALFQGICFKAFGSYTENSIVEDHLEAVVGPLAAHELGHNLGARHDSQVGCSDSDRYLMASSVGAVTGDKATNRYRFSSCTLSAFNTMFDFLNTNNFNCLKQLSSGHDPTALDKYNDTLYGQIYSHDQQCQQNLGGTSKLCRSEHVDDPSSICKYMMCERQNSVCSPYVPWEGTVCGDKKWCIGGECCDDPRAASTDSTCIFGDEPSCTNVIPSSPFLCYDKAYNETSCCLICQNYSTAIEGCEYGDRENGCVFNDCPSYSVYKRTVTCCKTCFIETSTEFTTVINNSTTTEETTVTSTSPAPQITTTTEQKSITSNVLTSTTTPRETTKSNPLESTAVQFSTEDTTPFETTSTDVRGSTTEDVSTTLSTTIHITDTEPAISETSSAKFTTVERIETTSRATTTSFVTKDVFMIVFCLGSIAVIEMLKL